MTRQADYAISETICKRIDELFDRGKMVGGLVRGLPRVELSFAFTALAYNLARFPQLFAA